MAHQNKLETGKSLMSVSQRGPTRDKHTPGQKVLRCRNVESLLELGTGGKSPHSSGKSYFPLLCPDLSITRVAAFFSLIILIIVKKSKTILSAPPPQDYSIFKVSTLETSLRPLLCRTPTISHGRERLNVARACTILGCFSCPFCTVSQKKQKKQCVTVETPTFYFKVAIYGLSAVSH